MQDVFIVGASRSPIGKRGKGLAGLMPADLLDKVLRGALERAGVDAANVGQVIGGCVSKSINSHSTSRVSLGCPKAFLKKWQQQPLTHSVGLANRQPR